MSAIADPYPPSGRREVKPETDTHISDGQARPLLLWRLREPMLAISSTPLGGGLGPRSWIINAQVGKRYARLDVENHLREIARSAGLADNGVGMLTAARVNAFATAVDVGVRAFATVGLSAPVWAADAEGAAPPSPASTINLVAILPVRLSDAALVNAVMTLTEAKTQALLEAGVSGTGTASDATCVLCGAHAAAERFCGPRSLWGARLARAVHGAVARGIANRGGAR